MRIDPRGAIRIALLLPWLASSNACETTLDVGGVEPTGGGDAQNGDAAPWPDCSTGACFQAIPQGVTLMGLFASASAGVWAVGFHDVAGGNRASILRFDGQWNDFTIGDHPPLNSVWSFSATDAWAVGETGVILRWDGRVWTQTPSNTQNYLVDVWGASSSDVWAVGWGAFAHWTGAGWVSSRPSGRWFYGVWGSAANDVWAVGDYESILHWNGTAWSVVQDAPGIADLNDIWGSGPDDVWAVGDSGTILYWNGSYWGHSNSPTGAHLKAVWGRGPADVWAVGWQGTIIHFNGSSWSVIPSGTAENLTGISGTASQLWAVGTTVVYLGN